LSTGLGCARASGFRLPASGVGVVPVGAVRALGGHAASTSM